MLKSIYSEVNTGTKAFRHEPYDNQAQYLQQRILAGTPH